MHIKYLLLFLQWELPSSKRFLNTHGCQKIINAEVGWKTQDVMHYYVYIIKLKGTNHPALGTITVS